MKRATAFVWDSLVSGRLSNIDQETRSVLTAELAAVMSAMPMAYLKWPQQSYAEDAAAATAYAIRSALDGDVNNPAWAARRAYEAADRAAIACLGMKTARGKADELAVLGHATVQRELRRQRRDVELLRSWSSHIDPSAIAIARHTANEEARTMLNCHDDVD